MLKKTKKIANKPKVPFTLDLRLIIAGVITYIISSAFFIGLTYMFINIMNSYYTEDVVNRVAAGGGAAYDQYIQYGSTNSFVGFVFGVALMTILFFIIFAEWFSFHKIATYRNAAIWGCIWAATFLIMDRLVDYFYNMIMSAFSGGYMSLMSVSSSVGPFYLVFLFLVAVIPMLMLFIHKLVIKLDK